MGTAKFFAFNNEGRAEITLSMGLMYEIKDINFIVVVVGMNEVKVGIVDADLTTGVAWFMVSVAISGARTDNVAGALANELHQALPAMVRTHAVEDLAAVKAWVE
ncbi:hypothetical protein Tco_1397999, partial [Tanacetum coccineum]